jgi:hypothetical protein
MMHEPNPASHSPLSPAAPVRRPEHRDGPFTLIIEQQTAKIPSHFFLATAFGAMAAAALFEVQGNVRLSRFVGSWATPLLVMGVYNKFVKVVGTL